MDKTGDTDYRIPAAVQHSEEFQEWNENRKGRKCKDHDEETHEAEDRKEILCEDKDIQNSKWKDILLLMVQSTVS